MHLSEKIKNLPGPILVLGASGFVGANLFRLLDQHRSDVFGTAKHLPSWRLAGISPEKIYESDLNLRLNQQVLLEKVKPRTIFDCIAYGGYSFQEQAEKIYETNFNRVRDWTELLMELGNVRYIHSGSSSEYGDRSSGPPETGFLSPNSHYSVSKCATSHLLYFLGKKKDFACTNIRIYSAYGPYEDSSRLIPQLLMRGLESNYPDLADPNTSRDFIYIEDLCEAFIILAHELRPEHYGESFNVGLGKKITLSDLAQTSKSLFKIPNDPPFRKYQDRSWDLPDWYANIEKIQTATSWRPKTPLREGLAKTREWISQLSDRTSYEKTSKRYEIDTKRSVSAIIACYKDAQAIPIMHERLTQVFKKLAVDYEIIFVNDNSPDSSEEVILKLSQKDSHVIGISHSRNFGSQSAFRSGMLIASKNSCVLLDGDLQDPPELIESFVTKWREGFDVIYGVRTERDAAWHMRFAYKAFYRVFRYFSYIQIPRDAGDFSLMDHRVVKKVLEFPEKDLFLRGIRAYVGFKQTGVEYVRPERMFGKSTNNFLKNIDWAKKGILSFSNAPLNAMSLLGVFMLFTSLILMIAQVVFKLIYPDSAPHGVTTILLTIILFGSINLFGLSILGEYLSKVFEEVKNRPHFIRRAIIRNGKIQETL